MKKLNKELVVYLSGKINKKEGTISKDISLLKREHGSCTNNAVAQIYARKHEASVLRFLDDEDKASLPHIDSKVIHIEKKKPATQEKIIPFLRYETNDYFVKEHVLEVNRAYTKGCYTSANILLRKIIENLLIDILKKKFSLPTKENKEIYYNIEQHRNHDFKIILKNLYDHRRDFGEESVKIIERLVPMITKIKDDANEKAHSWYHIVKTQKELNDLDITSSVELIKKLEIETGLRVKED